MKYRVQNFKKTKNGKSFSYPWIGYSYRNEKGVPSFKRLFSLNGFPDEAISAITAALSGKECGVEQPTVQFLQSVSIGAEMVAMIFAEKTGICSALNCLPPMDKKIALAMIIDRVTQALSHSKKSLIKKSSLFRRLQQVQNEEEIKEVIQRPMMAWYGTIKNLVKRLRATIIGRSLSTINMSGWRLSFDYNSA